ncbi:MAG: DNA topoisomerase I, partial [Candidatus Marinimicrobia bacterium]|nr:DNA topoisomerase I [Candidatus Neomarinimicrobiota bacterium]
LADLTLDLALQLLALPRSLGAHPETGEEVLADYGRYGPYLKTGSTNKKLTPPDTPLSVSLERAVELLAQARKPSSELKILGKHIKTGEQLVLKEGRYGPFISDGKINAAIPKNLTPLEISLEQAVELIDNKRIAGPKKRRRKK